MAAISQFQLYGRIEKVEPQDDGTVMAHGIASTEEVDSAGEIITADAVRGSLNEYRKFPTVRAMHQLVAAGKAVEIEVGDDNITRIVAHIVDKDSVSKIRAGVYSGFSLGGKVTKRNSKNNKIIEGILLKEISIVDSPANRSSVIELWKADRTEMLGASDELTMMKAALAEPSAATLHRVTGGLTAKPAPGGANAMAAVSTPRTPKQAPDRVVSTTSGQATVAPIRATPLAGNAMDAVTDIGTLSVEQVRAYLERLPQHERAEIIVGAVLMTGTGRRI